MKCHYILKTIKYWKLYCEIDKRYPNSEFCVTITSVFTLLIRYIHDNKALHTWYASCESYFVEFSLQFIFDFYNKLKRFLYKWNTRCKCMILYSIFGSHRSLKLQKIHRDITNKILQQQRNSCYLNIKKSSPQIYHFHLVLLGNSRRSDPSLHARMPDVKYLCVTSEFKGWMVIMLQMKIEKQHLSIPLQ